MIYHDLIVLGGGASGLIAAITAKDFGMDVAIVEGTDRIGKKLLTTGNGRCNFTNTDQKIEYYRGDHPEIAWGIVERFNEKRVVAFFEELGMMTKNRAGYLYPYSLQAQSVKGLLQMEIERLGITVKCQSKVKRIQEKKGEFRVICEIMDDKKGTGKTVLYKADRVILCSGSKASNIAGSDGSGYELAKSFGHTICPVAPALVQLRCAEKFYSQLAGVRVQGMVSLFVDEEFVCSDQGELQLTANGISGIPVFQVSRYASKALQKGQSVHAVLDFMPESSQGEVEEFLCKRAKLYPKQKMETFFTGIFPEKLAEVLLKRANLSKESTWDMLTAKDLAVLAARISNFRTVVKEANSFENAQVCAGGVSLGEVSPFTLESKMKKGLFFAGELLDVDGICGGYNLQWAWASGYAAGKGAADAEDQSV